VLLSGISVFPDPLPGLFFPSLGAFVAALDAAALDQGSLFGDSTTEDTIDRLRDAIRRHGADRLVLLVQGGELPDPFTRIASEVYAISDSGMQSLVLDDVGFGRAAATVVVQAGPFRVESGPVCTILGARVTVPLLLGDNGGTVPEGATAFDPHD